MPNRIKADRKEPIVSLAEADEALARMGVLQRRIDEIEAEAEARIESAKAGAAHQIGPLKAALQDILAGLEKYVTTNRPDVLGKAKSKTLNHGKVGFRKSTSTWWPHDAIVAEALEKLGYPELVETIRKPDKTSIRALAKQGEFDLADLYVEVTSDDVFFAEPSSSKVGERTPAE